MKKLAWMLIPVFVLAFAFALAVNTYAARPLPSDEYTCCSPGPTYEGVVHVIGDPPFQMLECDCAPTFNPNNCPLNCN